MTLPSGAIAFSDLNNELRRPWNQYLTLDDGELRNCIADKPGGVISLSDCRGKTYHVNQNAQTQGGGADQANFLGGWNFLGAPLAWITRVADIDYGRDWTNGWWLGMHFHANPNHGGNLWVVNNTRGVAVTLPKVAGNVWQGYVVNNTGAPYPGYYDYWNWLYPSAGVVDSFGVYAV